MYMNVIPCPAKENIAAKKKSAARGAFLIFCQGKKRRPAQREAVTILVTLVTAPAFCSASCSSILDF